MKKKISNKIFEAENLLKNNNIKKDELKSLERWLGYFQHERLMHLIVTVFTGLCDMISIVVILLSSSYAAFVLSALLTILFIFYIIHYYALENGVQKLCVLVDALHKKAV
jgi:hypothetical protein